MTDSTTEKALEEVEGVQHRMAAVRAAADELATARKARQDARQQFLGGTAVANAVRAVIIEKKGAVHDEFVRASEIARQAENKIWAAYIAARDREQRALAVYNGAAAAVSR